MNRENREELLETLDEIKYQSKHENYKKVKKLIKYAKGIINEN